MIQEKHLGYIDQLRGVAILLVALGHIFGYAGARFPAPFESPHGTWNLGEIAGFLFTTIFCNGFAGVMLFFVLSGFCIRWSHLHAGSFSFKGFYLRRIFRIYPAYLVWLGIFAAITSAPAWDIGIHALLIHNFSSQSFGSINPPFWSIALEWQIYLIYPLILWFANKFPPRIVLCITAFTGIVSAVGGTSTVQNVFHSEIPTLFSRLPTWLLFPWMLGFYQAERLHSGKSTNISAWWLSVTAIIAILIESCPKIHVLRVVPWSLVAYQVMLLCGASPQLTSKRWLKPVAFIGLISYSIYLSHDLVAHFYPFLETRLSIPRTGIHSGLLATLVCLPIFVLIGSLSYWLFEKPGIRLGTLLRRA
jgi:peptidoglycan/LPS O-acetylase OafA/YrhL